MISRIESDHVLQLYENERGTEIEIEIETETTQQTKKSITARLKTNRILHAIRKICPILLVEVGK